MNGIIVGIDFATLSPLQVYRLNEVGITEAEPYAIVDDVVAVNAVRVVGHVDTSRKIEVSSDSVILADLQEAWKENQLRERLKQLQSNVPFPTTPKMYYHTAESIEKRNDADIKRIVAHFHDDIKRFPEYGTEMVISRVSALIINLANSLLK
jgi:hypothetical protein